MSAIYKNKGGGRSQNTLMRQYLARYNQLYTRTGKEGVAVSCIQEHMIREESEHTDAAELGNSMPVVYKNMGRGRCHNTLMRQYLARQYQLYTRTGDEEGDRTYWCGSTWQDNASFIEEQGRKEDSEHTDAAVLVKTMSALYKKRIGGRSQNTLMRWYLARQCQLYTRTGEEWGVRTRWYGSTWQDNVSCTQ